MFQRKIENLTSNFILEKKIKSKIFSTLLDKRCDLLSIESSKKNFMGWKKRQLFFTDLVIVNYEKIDKYGQYNFDVLNYETYGLLYDWKSITHYRNKAFRKINAFGYTIESNVS